MYTDLATVDKQETAEQILNLFSPSSDSNAWIGLSWKGQNWLWSNGEKVTYYNWRRKSFCTQVNNEGLWIDKPCFYQHYFMCYTVNSNGNKMYTLIKQTKSWAASREYCRQNYNDLACIESQSENEEVMKSGQGTDFWIGLFNDPWKWSDGSVSAFRDWNNNEPNNWADPEYCVVLNGGWVDVHCSDINEVLCCEVSGYNNASGSCQRTGKWKIMSEGQALCRNQYGSDLPTIYNYQQAMQMKAQYLSSRYWIGLYRDRENWQWVNGETVLYSNWKTSHFCASADSEGYWQDRDCNDQLPFMCYKEYSNGTRTYTLLQTRKTWAAAQGHCRQLYTDLASIQNQSENEAVMEILYECAAVSSTSNGKWLYLPCLTTISFVCYEVLCAVASYPIYHLVRSPQSWHDAQHYCREIYTDLATVDKEETAKQILNLFSLSTDSNAWIGLSWKGQNWLWSNGEKVTYYNWRRKSFCTLVNNEGLWIDQLCFQQYYFMCYTVDSNGNKTYTLIKQAKSWAAAREYCRQNYNDLACIESQSENEEVMKSGQGTDFWIGLFNDPWKWSNGSVSAFRDWNNMEPNNWGEVENCVVLYRGGWVDVSCSLDYEVLCCEVGGYNNASGSCQRTGQVKIMSEGQALCRNQYGSDLPTIYNYQQAVQMKAQYLSSRFLWIGLYRDRENWQWVNGETVLYSNWKTSHFCASADSEGYWQDRDCNDQLPFMCYKEYSNGTWTYTLLQTRKTWAAAQGHCRQLYTDLASIQNQSENEAVMESGLGRVFWIGLFNDPWKWSDGSESLFRDWNAPQSVLYECAAVSSTSNGKWLYLPCLTKISFVCYEGNNWPLCPGF
ncbi:MRC2 protein, partial [Amia calva]|nr:MRC2 protein [Amia calva]